jgi:hypothetical protein
MTESPSVFDPWTILKRVTCLSEVTHVRSLLWIFFVVVQSDLEGSLMSSELFKQLPQSRKLSRDTHYKRPLSSPRARAYPSRGVQYLGEGTGTSSMPFDASMTGHPERTALTNNLP